MQSLRQKYRDEYMDFKNNKDVSMTEKLMKLNHVIKNATELTKFLENIHVWGPKPRSTHLRFIWFSITLHLYLLLYQNICSSYLRDCILKRCSFNISQTQFFKKNNELKYSFSILTSLKRRALLKNDWVGNMTNTLYFFSSTEYSVDQQHHKKSSIIRLYIYMKI